MDKKVVSYKLNDKIVYEYEHETENSYNFKTVDELYESLIKNEFSSETNNYSLFIYKSI